MALPCFLLVLACLPRAGTAASFPRWIAIGLLIGLLTHVRTMYQLFLPVLFVILLLDSRSSKATARAMLGVALGFLVVVLPWSIYVSQRVGTPVFLTANFGETLAAGLNPTLLVPLDDVRLEQRVSWTGPGKWIDPAENGYLAKDELKLPYVERDKLVKRRAIAWALTNPVDALYLTMRKLTYMWGLYPFFDNGMMMAIFGKVPIVLLMVLVLVALATDPIVRRRAARFYLMPLMVSGIAVISWGSWRFRQPADPAMLAVVAWWIVNAVSTRRAERHDRAAA